MDPLTDQLMARQVQNPQQAWSKASSIGPTNEDLSKVSPTLGVMPLPSEEVMNWFAGLSSFPGVHGAVQALGDNLGISALGKLYSHFKNKSDVAAPIEHIMPHVDGQR